MEWLGLRPASATSFCPYREFRSRVGRPLVCAGSLDPPFVLRTKCLAGVESRPVGRLQTRASAPLAEELVQIRERGFQLLRMLEDAGE